MSELWVCPLCGNSFAGKNMAHSCGRFELDALFTRSEPNVRAVFDTLAARVGALGAVTVIPQKTRATFQSRVRFLSVYPRKSSLVAGIWLRAPRASPRFRKIEHLGSSNFVHEVLLSRPDDVDAELIGWVRDAREAGLVAPARAARGPSRQPDPSN
jgi:hypothetical protein